ncbi:hypothetical protein [Sphingomonas sp.]|jgi:hypothetical protein
MERLMWWYDCPEGFDCPPHIAAIYLAFVSLVVAVMLFVLF